jgi:hypothetical protein
MIDAILSSIKEVFMPRRYQRRFGPLLGLSFLLAAAEPAAGELQLSLVGEQFAGAPVTVVVHGQLEGRRILALEAPVLIQEFLQDTVVMKVRTTFEAGHEARFAQKFAIDTFHPGWTEVRVEAVDAATGETAELFSYGMSAENAVTVAATRSRLLSTETFTVNAKFWAPAGSFGDWQLAGNVIKVPLTVDLGCCNGMPFDLFSLPIGPLPPGEYRLEVFESSKSPSALYHRETITVLPEPATVQQGRFVVEVLLDPPHGGKAHLVDPPSRDSALFYFFDRDNWEAMVKVLDGCHLNGNFWVFAAASTDVGYTLRVRDQETAASKEYRHPAGTPAPAVADLGAFACGSEGEATR